MLTTRAVVVLFTVFCFSVNASGSELNRAEVSEAKATIKKYQELRKLCAISKGMARKECFSALRDANQEYKAAKSIVAELKADDGVNLHLVSSVE